MQFDLTAKTLSDDMPVRLDRAPDACPRCHRAVHPQRLSAYVKTDGSLCQMIYRCTSLNCQEVFIANYVIFDRATSRKTFKFKDTAPTNLKARTFPEPIVSVSPAFCEIHRQAEAAAALALDQLEGIGLRKALEFLVKDYAGYENPDDETKIRSMPMANCIETYISDMNVKQCAKRAAWLGNDETHYSRKWETKDIEDLRRLVHLTVNGIDNALLAKKYMSEMS